ncbi:Required for respiratory growth protein 9, mitochondrial [Leucoagaricus sp. SymC.cos]|nr:Required for respiratory growth protein 9, mitochondrial [Leucoagaricus sp. SymC.cos]
MTTACRTLRVLRYYSTQPTTASVIAEARRKWGLSGIPTPRSILNDDSTPLPPSLSLSEADELDDADYRRNPNTPPLHLRKPPTSPTPTEWKAHRLALKKSFPTGWSPPRKLSREAMDGLRELHRYDPENFTTPVLAERFHISPEAVRRILKSKWEPSTERRKKWTEKQKRQREERLKIKRGNFEKERQEVQEILLAKQFSGGLSLKG